ncbi:MAG: hypothetical protein R3E97_13435 [Candidatus Eisenbacteria bacterium]
MFRESRMVPRRWEFLVIGLLFVGSCREESAVETLPTGQPPVGVSNAQATGSAPNRSGVSEHAARRDLEQGSARALDYLGMQRTLRRALAETAPSVGTLITHSNGDLVATNASELEASLGAAGVGSVVFLPSTVQIDWTGRSPLRVPAGVTLASDRAVGTSKGARIYTNDLGATLLVVESNGRVAGLDLMGPDPGDRTYQLERLEAERGSDGYYSVPAAIGIRVEGNGVAIENCEVWAFGRSAIDVAPGTTGTRVRHCFLHHNQRIRLGYGVYLDRADALVEANLFDWYRHCVAGSGLPGTSYEARFNFVLANASGHAFDMHGGRDREDGTDTAGTTIQIHDNIIEAGQFPAIVVRGRAQNPVEIHANQFRNPDPTFTIVLNESAGAALMRDNTFGVSSMRQR